MANADDLRTINLFLNDQGDFAPIVDYYDGTTTVIAPGSALIAAPPPPGGPLAPGSASATAPAGRINLPAGRRRPLQPVPARTPAQQRQLAQQIAQQQRQQGQLTRAQQQAAREQARTAREQDKLARQQERDQQQQRQRFFTQAGDAVGRAGDWMDSLPKPGGIGALLIIMLFFVWVIIPVNAGNSRLSLLWLVLTGQASLPIDTPLQTGTGNYNWGPTGSNPIGMSATNTASTGTLSTNTTPGATNGWTDLSPSSLLGGTR